MARKAGQLVSRGPRKGLVRVSLGREAATGTRKYHNRTTRGSFREVQMYLDTKVETAGGVAALNRFRVVFASARFVGNSGDVDH